MSKRSGIMLAYPFEERRLLEPKFGWRWPVIVQPKLDGERCRAVVKDGKVVLLSSECNEIISVPHINRELEELSDRNLFPLPEFDGELYVHGWDFSEIHSVVSRKSKETIHDKSVLVQFHIFDLATSSPQLARVDRLLTYYFSPLTDSIKLIPFRIAENLSDIMIFYDSFVDMGYEGIILRHINAPYVRKRSRFMMKFKPKKSDYYRIIGVLEAISKENIPLNMIGAFQCQGSDGTSFKIGAGRLTHNERDKRWKDRQSLIGKFAHVQYQNITSGGVPRFGLCIDISDKNPEEASGGGIL